jgi:hypothetical protein
MDKNKKLNFQTLFFSYTWKPIDGCPGRYILKDKKQYTLVELTENKAEIKTYYPENRDIIHTAEFSDGGIISYQKKDGRFIHTLNNREGYTRKLTMLGFEIPELQSEVLQ